MLDAAVAATGAPGALAYAGKTLAERVTGRFYTPEVLATDLAAQVAAGLLAQVPERHGPGTPASICDPFCGDGRLVTALLVALAGNPVARTWSYSVTLRDVDRNATAHAGRAVAEMSAHLGLRVEVHPQVRDSLAEATPATNDAVITNPPWELLKPDVRETAGMTLGEAASFNGYLRARCAELEARFPDARADVAWAGWGTNLARCGWDLALRCCRAGGVLGIVLPSTILADQASESMRRSAVRRSTLLDLASYPSEARLFDRVDQPVVAATFLAGTRHHASPPVARVRLFDGACVLRAEHALGWDERTLGSCGFALPVGFGAGLAGTLSAHVSGMPAFGDLEGRGASSLWAGRELDETRIATKLDPAGRNPFVKGRMVGRHSMVEQPTERVADLHARGLASTGFERLVWRDVARASGRRRMTGTVIPPGWVAGNSLHVAHFRDGSPVRLRALHAVVSSFVFEFQVRARLATGHMSLGVVRRARVPPPCGRRERDLARHAAAVLGGGGAGAEAALEARVARHYGISREMMDALLLQFPKVGAPERDAVLSPTLWTGRMP